jgi:hypothetical protein
MGNTRFHKLDFPTFDSGGDPLPFLNRCEHYFWGQRTLEEERVWLAAFHLQGAAQQWYMRLERDEGTPGWRRFSELLEMRFGPPLRSNPLGELIACRRTGTVADYQERFLALLTRAGPLTESQQIQLFLAGLQEPLSIDVQLQGPQSLETAMSLARAHERREQASAQQAVAAAAHPCQRPPHCWPFPCQELARHLPRQARPSVLLRRRLAWSPSQAALSAASRRSKLMSAAGTANASTVMRWTSEATTERAPSCSI